MLEQFTHLYKIIELIVIKKVHFTRKNYIDVVQNKKGLISRKVVGQLPGGAFNGVDWVSTLRLVRASNLRYSTMGLYLRNFGATLSPSPLSKIVHSFDTH